MNILVFIDYYPPRLGGIGEIAKNTFDEIKKKGHSVTIVTTGKIESDDNSKQIIRCCKKPQYFWFFGFWPAYKLLRKNSYDAIVFDQATCLSVLILWFLKRGWFKRVVTIFHVSMLELNRNIKTVILDNNYLIRPNVYDYCYKFFLSSLHIVCDFAFSRIADVIMTTSKVTNEEVKRDYLLGSKKIVAIYNGGNTYRFNPDILSQPTRAKLQISDNEIVIMYAGLFSTRKRLPVLIFAFKELLEGLKEKQVKLVLIGEGRGNILAKLQHLTRELKLENHVIFTGKIPNDELPPYLGASDIIVIPSAYEGLPLALLEAMAMKKPVIGTRVAGIPEIIENGKTGFVISPHSVKELSARLRELVLDEALRRRMGENALSAIKSRLNWPNIAEQYIELFSAH